MDLGSWHVHPHGHIKICSTFILYLFIFLIRNEEKYINRGKDTGERRDTREREKTKRRMRGPSHKTKTEQKRKHLTKEN